MRCRLLPKGHNHSFTKGNFDNNRQPKEFTEKVDGKFTGNAVIFKNL